METREAARATQPDGWAPAQRARLEERLEQAKTVIDKVKRDADLDAVAGVRDRLQGVYVGVYTAVKKLVKTERGYDEAMAVFRRLAAAHGGGRGRQVVCQSANDMLLVYDHGCETHERFVAFCVEFVRSRFPKAKFHKAGLKHLWRAAEKIWAAAGRVMAARAAASSRRTGTRQTAGATGA